MFATVSMPGMFIFSKLVVLSISCKLMFVYILYGDKGGYRLSCNMKVTGSIPATAGVGGGKYSHFLLQSFYLLLN